MASTITLPLALPALPSSYTAPKTGKLSPAIKLPIYPAGPSFIRRAKRQILQHTFADEDATALAEKAAREAKAADEANGDPYPGLGEEVESKELLDIDPKEWKKQDHYAVLGLGHLRYLANDEQIKVARESCVPSSFV